MMKLVVLFFLTLSTHFLRTDAVSLVSVHNKPNVRIIGGQSARAGQFPFSAALEIRTSQNSQIFCGGALINNDWILTSARCVNDATTATIHLGSNHLNSSDPTRVTLSSSHFVPHPDFNALTYENDIGLIKLRIPIEFTEYISPLALAFGALPDFIRAFAIGWGQVSDADGQLADALNYATVTSLSNAECKLTYGNQIVDSMLCVEGNYNEGTCIGDMGGPLLLTLVGGTQYYHVGVASFLSGNGCESTDPSGYTRTWPYIDWINETIEPA